jgi:hypothetical protein
VDLIWEIRNPDGGAMGMEFARARMAWHVDVLAHALPSRIDVEVTDADGRVVARAEGLEGQLSSPMARLAIRGATVERDQVWPDGSDLGKPVILPGGEVGILQEWWHAEDESEWRWVIELSNHR